jgi:glycine/D-amino acid oxidase-like deaminating enzyme
MPNLYRETAGPAVSAPPLDGDARADVAVVGGGFTGLSTALHLALKGVAVVLLEAREPGWGASGRNGGQVNPGLKCDPDVTVRDFGAELGGRMIALAGSAPDLVFNLVQRHRIECEARRNGTLRAAVRAAHGAAVRRTAEQLARRNAPVEILTGGDLAAATGTDRYAVAMLDRRGGDLHPLKFARGLARAAAEAGAAVHGGTRVLRVVRCGPGWQLRTTSGTVTAAHVVLATNGYTDDLWPGLRRTLVPVWGSIAATGVLPGAIAHSIMPTRAVLYESGLITVYYRVDGSGRLLIGGRGPQREIDSTAALAHLLGYARRLWPALAGVEWSHAWGGRLAMTRDHYPHVHEPAPGIIACLGYNGRGVAMATAMGAQIAGRIVDPDGEFALPVTRMKPIALHAAWPLAVHAVVIRGRIADFFGL